MPPFDGDTPGIGVSGYKPPARLTGCITHQQAGPSMPGILEWSIRITLREHVGTRSNHTLYMLLRQIDYWSNNQTGTSKHPGWCYAGVEALAAHPNIQKSSRTVKRCLKIARDEQLIIERIAYDKQGPSTHKKLSERGQAWVQAGGNPVWIRTYQGHSGTPTRTPRTQNGATSSPNQGHRSPLSSTKTSPCVNEASSAGHAEKSSRTVQAPAAEPDFSQEEPENPPEVSSPPAPEPVLQLEESQTRAVAAANEVAIEQLLAALRPRISPGSVELIETHFLGCEGGGLVFSAWLPGHLRPLLTRMGVNPVFAAQPPSRAETSAPEPATAEPAGLVDLATDPQRAELLRFINAGLSDETVEARAAAPEPPAEPEASADILQTAPQANHSRSRQPSQGRVLNPDGTIDYDGARRLLKQLGKLPQQRRQAGPTGLDAGEMRSMLLPREAGG